MKVKVEYEIYIIRDSHGNCESVVVDSSGETAQICTLKNADGEPLYFESEAYHLKGWCRDENLQFHLIERKEEIEL